MTHEDPTPSRGNLTLDERLERIEDALKSLRDAIDGLPLRVRALEIVVYSGCAVALLGVIGALLALVIKGHA